MKIDLPRALAPRRCPRLSFVLLSSYSFCSILSLSFLTHCSHDLFVLSICSWVREHIATFPLLRATLHSITNAYCARICMLIDFFFFSFLYTLLLLLLWSNKRRRKNEQTNERRRRGEKRETEKGEVEL